MLNLLTQGMVQGLTFRNKITHKYVASKLIKDPLNPLDPDTGEDLDIIYEKMSKSKHNGVEPSEVINKYGADTARLFILFKAPPEKDLEWNESDVEGQFRFINRIWRIFTDTRSNFELKYVSPSVKPKDLTKEDKQLRRIIHRTIKEVTNDLEINSQFNTAISEIMILFNALYEFKDKCKPIIINQGMTALILLIAPFAPHLSEELWKMLGKDKSIHDESWLDYDPTVLVEEEYKLIIQINGKVRGFIMIPSNYNEEQIKEESLNSQVAKKWLKGQVAKRLIIIKGKLINIVI